MADGDQRFQDFHFALGQQQAGVVQRGGSGLGHIGKREQIVVIERRAVQFVDGLHHSDQRAAIENRNDQQREDSAFNVSGAAFA